jgi:7-keto-8-aminopelargonate synthetase-like enzyme
MTEPEPLQQLDRTYVRFRRRKLSFFSGCDYFRLSSHPRLVAAFQNSAKRYGLSVAASRLTTGNHPVFVKLEQCLARFFEAPSALLVASGYQTNLVVAQALAGEFSHALLDERAHASLIDAAQFLNCPVLRYGHHDAVAVAKAVQRCGPAARIILLTDGLFASDGSVAPLADYLKALPKDAMMLVDDAHGAGVIGRTGQGSLQHCGVGRSRIVQTITLSKAFGCFGGAILSPARLRERILERSRLFMGCTPPPIPTACAALEAIRLLRAPSRFRTRLAENIRRVREQLQAQGIDLPENPGPMLGITPADARQIRRLKQTLLAARIYPPYIQYPGGPAGGSFRFVISSEHTREQLDNLAGALATVLASPSPHHATPFPPPPLSRNDSIKPLIHANNR